MINTIINKRRTSIKTISVKPWRISWCTEDLGQANFKNVSILLVVEAGAEAAAAAAAEAAVAVAVAVAAVAVAVAAAVVEVVVGAY